MMYADPDQQARAEARETGRRDMLEQRADETISETGSGSLILTRDELLRARLFRVENEAGALLRDIITAHGFVENATDGGELWMRALEGALSSARDSLLRVVKHARVAEDVSQ